MNSTVYLHHYPASLFSEKVRLMLGYLGVSWNSVEIASVMPRPLLMPLTGGYRKTPTLQIGADVYCDTAVIATALARHANDTTLFAHGFTARRVADWADSTLFRTTVAINFRPEAIGAFMGQLSAEEIAAFQADRAELAGDAPLVSLPPDAAIADFDACLTQLERSLGDAFLFCDEPGIADFSLYHCLWFVDRNPANAALLAPYDSVRNWMTRMAAFGHGDVRESSAEEALACAAGSEPEAVVKPSAMPAGVEAGMMVTVTPTDYGKVPVAGRLQAVTDEEIIIERETAETGRIHTHFPNVGFHLSTG